MRLIHALLIAFSTYSRIPVPQAVWNDENKRYAMCFFPLVGVVIGLLMALWLAVCERCGFGPLLRAAVCTVLPIAVTGGIHMDGLMDTTDAMASWRSPEERLEILKDSHVGAFAVMACGVYLLLMTGVFSEARWTDSLCIGACYVLSRALSALLMTWLRGARKNGMLAGFAQTAKRNAVTAASALYTVVCAGVLIAAGSWAGVCALLGAGVCTVAYRYRAYRYFGGVTGDQAGWFQQVTELICLACVIVGRSLMG